MDKTSRKIIHDLANALGMRSKSKGNGLSRQPVLFKTSSTRSHHIDSKEVDRVLQAGLCPRHLTSSKQASRQKNVGRGPGKPGKKVKCASVTTYRDGDLVGASAPRIPTGNKGRTMLEKMGWSDGTGLGAVCNKGDLDPVSQAVKTTKVGLN